MGVVSSGKQPSSHPCSRPTPSQPHLPSIVLRRVCCVQLSSMSRPQRAAAAKECPGPGCSNHTKGCLDAPGATEYHFVHSSASKPGVVHKCQSVCAVCAADWLVDRTQHCPVCRSPLVPERKAGLVLSRRDPGNNKVSTTAYPPLTASEASLNVRWFQSDACVGRVVRCACSPAAVALTHAPSFVAAC